MCSSRRFFPVPEFAKTLSVSYTVVPRTSTRRTLPRISIPSKGVQSHAVCRSAAATVQVSSGSTSTTASGFGEAEDAARVGGEAGYQIVDGEAAVVRRSQQQRQCRVQSGEARGRIGTVLFGSGVGSVIGGEAVDHVEVLPERSAVGGIRQHGTDLGPPAQPGECGLVEEQVVRGGLTGDGDAALAEPGR